MNDLYDDHTRSNHAGSTSPALTQAPRKAKDGSEADDSPRSDSIVEVDFEKSLPFTDKENNEHGPALPLHRIITPGVVSIPPTDIDRSDVTYPEGGLRAWLVVFGSFSGMVSAFHILGIAP